MNAKKQKGEEKDRSPLNGGVSGISHSSAILEDIDSRVNDADSPNVIGDTFSGKLAILAEAIKELDEAILTRKNLSKRFKGQIEKEISEVKDHMGFLQTPWRGGFLPEVEFIRISLHKSLTSRKKERRSEEHSMWSDIVSLVKERRKLVMEHQELLNAWRKVSDGD